MQHPDLKGTGARGNNTGVSLGSDAPVILLASPKINHLSTAVLERPRSPYPIYWRPDRTAPGTGLAGLGG